MFRVAFALESGWKNSRGERHPNLIAAASWHRRAIRAGNTVSLRRLRRLLARRPALELPEDAQLLR
jgi:hypothetical protein